VASVYSFLLAQLVSAPFGDTTLGAPAAGTKWIVKDMTVFGVGGAATPKPGFSVHDTVGGVLMAVQQPFSMQGIEYRWSGTQVIETTSSLVFRGDSAGWAVRVSGYILTLP
jgi:hypothetical protein